MRRLSKVISVALITSVCASLLFLAPGLAGAHPILADPPENQSWHAPASSSEAVYIGDKGTPTLVIKKSAVQAQTETEYYEKLNGTNQQFLIVFVFVAVFMAVGGVFGVMNTMFAAISQRIKDIGVLRILGFARWQVLLSFFLETLLIAAIGGLIGVALGSLANGWNMTSIAGGANGGGKSVMFKLTVDLNIWLGVLTFSLAMGILGGLLPALTAMRSRALESLR